jgi:hypothetical protein
VRSPIPTMVKLRARLLRSPAETLFIAMITALWLAGAAAGLGILASYATAAPPSAAAPRLWPAQSKIPREPGAVTLVAFLHPRCPCSEATLSELGRVLARTPPGCRITIAFYAPTSRPPEWGRTGLRERAESLAGVRVTDDTDAREAALFGAERSGHVMVFGPDGALRFAGGITASRGHEGDNQGEACVIAALNGSSPAIDSTPTFGCQIAPGHELSVCPPAAAQGAPR